MKQTTWVALGWLVLSCSAQAASFACLGSTKGVEKLICSDIELSGTLALDEKLARVYAGALVVSQHPETIRVEQKAWLKERNQCKDVACLKAAYRGRIAQLEPALRSAKPIYVHCTDIKEPRSCNHGPSGKGYAVCESYLKHLNTLNESVTCDIPIPLGFKRPDWEEVDVLQHLDWAYQIETRYRNDHLTFDEWKEKFIENLKDGKITPHMRKARVKLVGDKDGGKESAVLGYTQNKRCGVGIKSGEFDDWNVFPRYRYLLLKEDASPIVEQIDWDGDPVGELLLFGGKAYIADAGRPSKFEGAVITLSDLTYAGSQSSKPYFTSQFCTFESVNEIPTAEPVQPNKQAH